MREQVCLYMCPYARFQSAMIDKDTLIVSYDSTRGEPRGSRKRGTHPDSLGDCTDCRLCVQVCPTGIDIRNGLQYQCIGCAHCIDACAEVMDKMGYAPGLVRYTTLRALDGGPVRIIRGRSIGYAIICAALITAFVIALWNRDLLSLDIVRPRDTLFRELSGGLVVNDYEIRIANKTQSVQTYRLGMEGLDGQPAPAGMLLLAPDTVTVSPGEVESLNIEIRSRNAIPGTRVVLEACTLDGMQCEGEETPFIAPAQPGVTS